MNSIEFPLGHTCLNTSAQTHSALYAHSYRIRHKHINEQAQLRDAEMRQGLRVQGSGVRGRCENWGDGFFVLRRHKARAADSTICVRYAMSGSTEQIAWEDVCGKAMRLPAKGSIALRDGWRKSLCATELGSWLRFQGARDVDNYY